ncbi:GntR family transcriptional regulator [Sinomonas cellulolyticus]|uniref:GntR family transcriptional regulator n=1 Tax=Sinomonas cellulolyticus TaxID=2801916 RepID=A0ABS1K1F9_9MICC|nr:MULTISPECIES: GntR family transcriptional regulator [Sinomonas]MBL0705370.1 GntR family transcriptional regulator [Sinomonas cellulolyticus]GHG40820.1 GntR family transcriptional regulator [Sinomonas sp. KCTC 49339]
MAQGDFPGRWRPNQELAVPLFEQLRRRILEMVDAGALAVGAKLPSVRSLAGELGVAPHTVARAYRELEEAGVLATAGRAGTTVAPRGRRDEELRTAASAFAGAAVSHGCTLEEAVALLSAAYARRGQPTA